jgi:hypothetical protein
MAVPLTASAQMTQELSYGYDNSSKTVLMEMVENAINAGAVTFDTQAHKDEFLALISNLYDARDAGNWNTVVTIANQLRAATANIVGVNQKDLVESLCFCSAGVYTYSDLIMLLTPEDEAALAAALANGGSAGGSPILYVSRQIHIEYKTIIHHKDGDTIWLPCTSITQVIIDDGKD